MEELDHKEMESSEESSEEKELHNELKIVFSLRLRSPQRTE